MLEPYVLTPNCCWQNGTLI